MSDQPFSALLREFADYLPEAVRLRRKYGIE